MQHQKSSTESHDYAVSLQPDSFIYQRKGNNSLATCTLTDSALWDCCDASPMYIP